MKKKAYDARNKVKESPVRKQKKSAGRDKVKESPAKIARKLKKSLKKVYPREEHFVYVRNIAKTVTEDYLKIVFAKCGEVKDAVIIRKKREPGYAFVYFKIRESLKWALRMDTAVIRGESIRVMMGDPSKRKVFGSDSKASGSNAGRHPY